MVLEQQLKHSYRPGSHRIFKKKKKNTKDPNTSSYSPESLWDMPEMAKTEVIIYRQMKV